MAIILCSFEGCDRKRHGKGLCEAHYHQQRRGSTLKPLRDKRTVAWRLDQKTLATPTCWLWTGSIVSGGYGNLHVGDGMKYVHRLSFERYLGEIPNGMYVDHKFVSYGCPKNCLNPDHLRLATHGENMQNFSDVRSDSATGYTGVHYYKSRDKYTARISFEGKDYHLGYFLTKESAWEARKAKEIELFTHSPLVLD